MIVLGIDPGSRKAGYGLIELVGRSFKYISSGVLSYDREKDFLNRMGLIHHSCLELIKDCGPDEVALESLIYVKSVPSLAKLSQARGAMIAAFMATHYDKVFEYSPNLIKSTVTGHGHAGKEAIEKSVKMILGRDLQISRHDESDALAIAICHGLMRKTPRTQKGHAKSRTSSRTLKQALKHLENL